MDLNMEGDMSVAITSKSPSLVRSPRWLLRYDTINDFIRVLSEVYNGVSIWDLPPPILFSFKQYTDWFAIPVML